MTFIEAICYKFEKRRADLFQDYPNAIRLNLVHLCPSVLLFPFGVFLCVVQQFKVVIAKFHSTFLGILGATKLHHFA